MSVSPARWAAFQILLRILRQDSYAIELLHSDLTGSLKDKDLRLATELVFGVLRQQLLLDHLLSAHSKVGLPKLDVEVRVSLRLGLYQLLFLEQIPVRAAINESVELVKSARLRSAAGYVNAVLRKMTPDAMAGCLKALNSDSLSDLSLRYSHPEWLVRRWERHFGQDRLIELLQHNNQTPKVWFRINSPDLPIDVALRALEQQSISVQPHPLFEEVYEVTDGRLAQTPLFRSHRIAVQDAGSQLIPRLLDLQSSDVCLDLCSGPGGKASQIAQLKQSSTPVFAVDRHRHRLRVARALHSAQWKSLQWVVADATRPLPFNRLFDKILLDAPCSGTGTLQRHPEIRWRLKPELPLEISSLQTALLENAIRSLKPGGTLVYSTCSLENEENEEVVEAVITAHPEIRLVLPGNRQMHRWFDDRKFFRLFPPESRTDGFFAAVLQKS